MAHQTRFNNVFFLEIVRLFDGQKTPLAFTEETLNVPKETLVNVVDEVGSNLAGGLKLLGFFAFSPRLTQATLERLLTKLQAHADFFHDASEFSSPDLFLFTHNGKTARVDSLMSDGSKGPIAIERFRRPGEVVGAVHLFLNKTFFVEEKEEEPQDSRDFSLTYNVRLPDPRLS